MKKIFVMAMILSSFLYSTVYENGDDGSVNRWVASAGATVNNVTDDDTGSKVIKFSDSAYKYYRMGNLVSNSDNKIQWDIKTNAGFIAYVYVSTTNGDRLFYYTILNRDYGKTTSGIHHGLGEDTADGEWHTITRDLDAELHEFEPSNNVTSIKWFKLRAIGDTFVDNIIGSSSSSPSPSLSCSVIEDAEDGTTNKWTAPEVTVTNEVDADTGSKVIKLNSDSYKYSRMDSINRSAKKIEWDIKTNGGGFIAYVYASTTNGTRLFYYTIVNRDYGKTTSGIHHGLGEDTADGEWHTITRDLEAELHKFEPSNHVISIKSFKIRSTGDTFIDNIKGCDGNSKPIADAGQDQTIVENTTVQLDGSASTNNPLTYQWTIINKPNGSNATLSDSTLVNPTFIADTVGTYKIQLIVNNGIEDSVPDIVTINASVINHHELDICNQWSVSNSGGVAGTYDEWDISQIPTGASFDFEFEAYNIPDKFQVDYNGTVRLKSGWRGSILPDTGESLAGPGRFNEYGLFVKIDSDTMVVTATGEQQGTAWYYRVRCVNNN